ncbi:MULTISPECIES: hypothetical protein [Streptomyces]|uniref:hypothetical protein n=1 Tax=Streptomyces TaxID=1883 RepID=UPI00166F8215|nr:MULTISPECIES: hypothetical protein [Streptomyces]UFR03544.1 hypothetical protein KBP30_21295 [Streptomyces sp. Go40/10]GGS57849.1 hypothetical protein GCM10010206_19510 [Streptomyces cinerochromogenes]
MDAYLLIESAGPAGAGGDRFVGDACRLVRQGGDVTLLLTQDGVLGAVADSSPRLGDYLGAGGALWVDAFSLRRRGVAEEDVEPRARLVDMDDVAARLLRPGLRAVWH